MLSKSWLDHRKVLTRDRRRRRFELPVVAYQPVTPKPKAHPQGGVAKTTRVSRGALRRAGFFAKRRSQHIESSSLVKTPAARERKHRRARRARAGGLRQTSRR